MSVERVRPRLSSCRRAVSAKPMNGNSIRASGVGLPRVPSQSSSPTSRAIPRMARNFSSLNKFTSSGQGKFQALIIAFQNFLAGDEPDHLTLGERPAVQWPTIMPAHELWPVRGVTDCSCAAANCIRQPRDIVVRPDSDRLISHGRIVASISWKTRISFICRRRAGAYLLSSVGFNTRSLRLTTGVFGKQPMRYQ